MVPLEDIKQVAEKYPGSYFTGAVSFAESCAQSEIEICSDGARYMHLADTTGLIECMDKFAISTTAMATNLLRCMLELNKDSLEIVKTYVSEMIRLRMYEEFQKYVFSRIDRKEMIELRKLHKFDTEFLTIYPYRNKNNSTMLMCFVDVPSIALEIIRVNPSEVGHINNNGSTALILACNEKSEKVALEILATGNGKPEQINCAGNTALIIACSVGLHNVALAILTTETKGLPIQVSKIGNTALIAACANGLHDVAVAIIAIAGWKEIAGQVNKQGSTALIKACYKDMSDIALAILATETAGKPDQVNDHDNTALIWACKNGMEDVALAILATGPGGVGGGNPHHEDENGQTALDYAEDNNLDDVVEALEALSDEEDS